MIIGIAKEIKENENRVSLTPSAVDMLIKNGNKVLVETSAGEKSGFSDQDYRDVGAQVLAKASEIWKKSDMIVKVKEPLESEFKFFREDLIIFTYLHLASNKKLSQALIDSKTTAIAYETIQLDNGKLPLLTPMSEIAGKLAIQHSALYLESSYGGKGKLLDGAPGVPPAHIVVLGAGVVGSAAIKRAIGSGARVTALDVNIDQLRYLDEVFYGKIETLYSNDYNLRKILPTADVLISAVLIPGAKAPKLVKEDMVKLMEAGSVIVDVAIDQGGCVETITEATSHSQPVFIKHGVVHSAISNIPSSVCQTATSVLSNTTIPYVLNIAKSSVIDYAKKDQAFKKGINTYRGFISNAQVASSLDMTYKDLDELI